jgi:UDP-N-acetylmuramoyl-tripeptide--D-alanyl-D-alanine ligase
MGARGPGHIARLAQVARPDVGIVTSVAMAHVEYFGDLDGVARAKSELVTALPESGIAVLNFDDPRVARMAAVSPCPVLGYALAADAEVRAEDVTLDNELQPSFRLVTPWGKGEVRLSLHGLQQVPNALAAAAAALWCGLPLEAVASSLEAVTASPLRMELRRPPDGPVLLVDCYNANPASTDAALRALAALPAARRVAVLGLMAELGPDTEEQHRALAVLAEDLGIEVRGYQTGLYDAAVVPDVDGAVELLRSLSSSDAVLLKGSRVARLEDVVTAYGTAVGAQSPVADA